MKVLALATVGLLVLASPLALADRVGFRETVGALTLDASVTFTSLLTLAGYPPGIDEGESRVMREVLTDPAGIQRLNDLPDAYVEDLILQQLGPIYGAHIRSIPTTNVLAALTLGDGPIPASSLRDTDLRATIRYEDPADQARDLHALLWDGPP